MSTHKYTREITELLLNTGVADSSRIVRGSKHIRVEILGPQGCRKLTTSASPSDHRTMLNFRAQVRRAAREVGLCS